MIPTARSVNVPIPAQPQIGGWIALAGFVALVIRPLLYTVLPVSNRLADLVADPDSARIYWWWFVSWILFWQWAPFAFVAWSLGRTGLAWSALGLDWTYFKRRAAVFVALGLLAAAAALLAPHWLYEGDVPSVSDSFFLLPVTGPERLFWLVSAGSAAVCEEVCYRGLPLTLLAKSKRAAWCLLPVTMVSFVFVHGAYGAAQPTRYLVAGGLFGGAFMLLG